MCDPSSASFTELRGRCIAIAVDSSYHYREGGLVELSEDQVIVIGADGLWETRDEAGQCSAKNVWKRLSAMVRKPPPVGFRGQSFRGVPQFGGSAKQQDDITLAVIKVVG